MMLTFNKLLIAIFKLLCSNNFSIADNMFSSLQGSAKLEVEVTNLAAKAGKGMSFVQLLSLWLIFPPPL